MEDSEESLKTIESEIEKEENNKFNFRIFSINKKTVYLVGGGIILFILLIIIISLSKERSFSNIIIQF